MPEVSCISGFEIEVLAHGQTFMFELTDLYNKRNVPKVIFCIHVLRWVLWRLGGGRG